MVLFRRNKSKVILTRDEHDVSRKDIDRDVLDVLYRLNNKGYTACLVGGAVRDLLLGRKPKDFDVGTTARPNAVRRLFRNSFLIGRRFRLVHIRFGKKVIECSTFRKQPEPVDATNDEEASLYMHHDNTFGTPKEDATRRDFTINGMFYDIDSFKIIDYVGGLDDLKKKIVRTIGDPDTRFCEDPVRMLRAIRFASRLDFSIDKKTWSSIKRNHSEIFKSAPARLYEEMPKLFVYGSGAEAIRLMKKSGLLDDLLPGLSSHLDNASDKGRFFWSCLDALDEYNSDEDSPNVPLMWAAMCYPLFVEKLEDQRKGHQMTEAREAVREAASNLPMPRTVFFHVVHMLTAQSRFEGWSKQRFSKQHFVRQKSFLDASELNDILLAADGNPIPKKKPWMDLYRECGSGEQIDEEPDSGRPRRRRRRRRRKPAGQGN